jgi:hypothetical protein
MSRPPPTYTNLVQTSFAAENIAERITILLHQCDRTGRCTTNDERILNKIDRDITRILLHAETDCKKAKGHAWSPLLANAGQTVIAAKWHLSNVLNGRLHLPLWDRAQAIIAAKAQVKEAYQLLCTVQRHAKEIRDSFLEDQADHLAETQQIDKYTALRQLLNAERQTMMFRKLGIWMKGQEHVSLDRILIPNNPADLDNTTWTAVLKAQGLYELLTQEGQKHYRQASPTPFVTSPTATLIGPFTTKAHCNAILNGTFDFLFI